MPAQAVPDSHNVFSEERIQTLSSDSPEESFLKFLLLRTEADSVVSKFSGGTIDISATVVPRREEDISHQNLPSGKRPFPLGPHRRVTLARVSALQGKRQKGKRHQPHSRQERKIPENPFPSFELGKGPIILFKTSERRLRTEFSLKGTMAGKNWSVIRVEF